MGPTGTIHIESEAMLALRPGEARTIRARWEGIDGTPVRGGRMSFALLGMPRDSTLAALVATTDEQGRASVELIAGSMPATFQVRVTAEGAVPAYVEVAVGPEGFGTLVVAVTGGERRAIARRTVIVHQGDILCPDAITRRRGDRVREISSMGDMEVVLGTLAAGQPFTVAARAEGPTGMLLASGCLDRVRVPVDNTLRATIELLPVPLSVDGEYAAHIDLASSGSASALVEGVGRALVATIAARGGDGALLLDALDGELRRRGAIAIADSLAAQRRTGEVEAFLESRLSTAGEGPSVAAARILSEVQARIDVLSVDGTLSLASAPEGGPSATFFRQNVWLGSSGAERIAADLTARSVEPRSVAEVRWVESEDRLVVDELPIALPLGRLVLAMLDSIARAAGAGATYEVVIEGNGCSVLTEWVEEKADVASACDPSCRFDACKRAAEQTFAMIEEATTELDDKRSQLVLRMTVAAEDTDGDLGVDVLRGIEVRGAWVSRDSSIPPEPLASTFTASRLAGML
jgi:hypothetical protein